MPATVAGIHLGPDTHANRPAANASGLPVGSLYVCSDHNLIYQTDGSAWSTWATVGGAGASLQDQDAFTYLDATEGAAPAAPASGYARIYAKSDGRIYSKDDAGVEYGPFDADSGGSAGPLLYADSLTLHADGDDFDDTALTGWTLSSISTPSAVTTEVYDDTCLDIVFAAQGDRLYKSCPAGDFTAYLTFHGVTNSTPDSLAAQGGMLALCFTDNAGTGTGMSLYNDQSGYMWGVSSHVYASSGSVILSGQNNVVPTASASGFPVVYRLSKSGSTITGGISYNGGVTYKTATRTDSTTFTRVGIHRLFSGGGTNPTLRVGRFNLA